MPYTAEQKREQRARVAAENGKRYRPQKKADQPKLAIVLKPKVTPVCTWAPTFTTTEYLDQARMETEDVKTQMERFLTSFDTKQVIHTKLYVVGQIVNIKPVFLPILGLPASEHYVRFRLVKQSPQGLWRLAAVKGPNKNREICYDLTPEMLC